MLPVKEEFQNRTANAPLARPHATAGLQFRLTPPKQTGKCTSSHIFAPANESFIIGKVAQLVRSGECPDRQQLPAKPQQPITMMEQVCRRKPGSREASDLSFDERLLQAPDAGQFSRAINMGN